MLNIKPNNNFTNYFIQEILLCGNKFHLIIGILLAVFKSIAFYIIVFLQNKNEPLEVTMIYSGLGDIQCYQFLPFIGRFQFGESQVYENLNQGLVGFTLPSIFLHSFLFATLGIFGFVFANIIVIYLFYCFLLATLKLTGIPNILAFSITALLTSGYYVHTLFSKILNIKLFTIWGEVFPRAFVSEIFFLITLTLLILIVSRYEITFKSILFWSLLGLFTSFLFQSNPYFGLPIILLQIIYFTAICIYKYINNQEQFNQFLKNILITVIGFIVSLIPFILQQILVTSDIKRRYGKFPVKDIEFLSLDKYHLFVFCILIIQLLIVLFLIRFQKVKLYKLKNSLAINLLVLVLIFCSYISMPVFLLLSHQGIQLSKFAIVLNIVTSYSLILSSCLIVNDLRWLSNNQFRIFDNRYNKFVKFSLYTFIFLLSFKSVFVIANYRTLQTNHMRMDLYPGINRNYYRQDYADLITELKNPQYQNLKVLGTFDHQVQVYWQTFKKGNSYIPDIFVSTLSDEQSESRLIKLAKIINLNENNLVKYITVITPGQASRQSINFFGLAKYQVNNQYTLKPIEEYTQDQQEIINNNSILNPWDLIIPPSEIERMKNKFDNTKIESLDNPRLDFIVLTNDSFFDSFAPNNSEFKLVFKNKTFRMWVKKKYIRN